jgi:ATP-dependent exoDNAse (exonuclease V) alpha subunit
MTEQTGIEAKTIHRLLEIDPKNGQFKRNEESPLDCDLLVIDEASMVDVPLMNSLQQGEIVAFPQEIHRASDINVHGFVPLST